MIEIWRGDELESFHCGSTVVINSKGKIVAKWGNESVKIYPRSFMKIFASIASIGEWCF